MRKHIALALAALCAVAVLSGCADSGDSAKAKKLLKSGDKQYEAFSAGFLELADQLEKFFVGHAEGTITDPDEISQRLQAYDDTLKQLLEQVKLAKEPYRKVLAMKGVQHYKDYANKRLQMLGQIDKTRDVVDRTFPLITKGVRSGKPADANALQGAKRELIGIEMELSFMEVEADEIDEDFHVTK